MLHYAPAQARPRGGLAQFGRHASRLITSLSLALQVRKERRLLMSLDERSLKDMGFNRGEAHGESTRGFWDVPVDRLRT